MKKSKSLKLLTFGILGTAFITSCSTVNIVKTAYNAYSTYKDTKDAVKGYQNLKNIGSITRIKPVFYPYKFVKVEVQLKNVEGRNNEELAEILKENIEYDLNNFFKEYELTDKKICEVNCGKQLLIIRFKEKSYKSVLQKWALKGKFGGTIQYIDGETGKVILEDEIGNRETFYDLAKTIGQVLELKAYRSGFQKYVKDEKKVKEYQDRHKDYLQNRENEKFVKPDFEKTLQNT